VMKDGEVVWSEGFGWADIEQQVAVTPLTRFRIGSVSKSLTAAAVARLVQQGKLDVDAPVQRYVPTFPDKGVVITTREVGVTRRSPITATSGRAAVFSQHLAIS